MIVRIVHVMSEIRDKKIGKVCNITPLLSVEIPNSKSLTWESRRFRRTVRVIVVVRWITVKTATDYTVPFRVQVRCTGGNI
jgi:hypothetical protein